MLFPFFWHHIIQEDGLQKEARSSQAPDSGHSWPEMPRYPAPAGVVLHQHPEPGKTNVATGIEWDEQSHMVNQKAKIQRQTKILSLSLFYPWEGTVLWWVTSRNHSMLRWHMVWTAVPNHPGTREGNDYFQSNF